jgi:methylaspartate mutase epsilon subunit
VTRASAFGDFVARAAGDGRLVVQPRMGFSDPAAMRAGLIAVRDAHATTVGTLTLDSYTRTGHHERAARALARRWPLNGFPIVAHGTRVTRRVLDGVRGTDFPVQVRHGSAQPEHIMAALVAAGLDATEGGPVSYCLPYGRTPLAESVRSWARGCEILSGVRRHGAEPHLETFGGCMMGQLCPPSLLVAISLLEALFFRQHGIRSISLSYAQQTDPAQDLEAVHALRILAREHLSDVDWHVVVYAYMGLYPRTRTGALMLLEAAVRLAVTGGAARLIVKTVAEAQRIPTIAENVEALEIAALATHGMPGLAPLDGGDVLREAQAIVEAVVSLHSDVGRALLIAFGRGLLDVPYCLHPDNRGDTTGYIDAVGRLRWGSTGRLPIAASAGTRTARIGSEQLLDGLTHIQRSFDGDPAVSTATRQ